jgi:hypothetical protein
MLSGYEDDKHEHHENICVKPQKIELDLIVNDLHPVMRVKVLFVLDVKEHQGKHDQQKDDGCVKAEKCGQGPKLECYD